MPNAEVAWMTGLLVLVALLGFMWRRRRTVDYAEARALKANLPRWVRNIEIILILAFGQLWAAAGFKLYIFLRGRNPLGTAPPAVANDVYLVVGMTFTILPLALLSANTASWVIPSLRHANEVAFRGTRISFKSANAGLIRLALLSVPFGMATLLIAAIAPWSR